MEDVEVPLMNRDLCGGLGTQRRSAGVQRGFSNQIHTHTNTHMDLSVLTAAARAAGRTPLSSFGVHI